MANTITFKAAKADARYITVSDGNLKLKPTKETKYIIWNLPAIKTCPYATEMCKSLCYAIKAERCRPSAKASRAEHFEISKADNFVERMIFTIESNLSRPGYKAAKRVVVRIHESGDFYNEKYAEKWLAIAEHFKADKRVVFMAYTKSVDFFAGKEIPENMVVRFSLWDDTDPAEAAKAAEMGLPVYTAVEKFTTETKAERCLCKNCSTCNKCWSALAVLKCEIH